MAVVFFGLLIGLEIKHYIADYFLQPGWILAGKGNIFHARRLCPCRHPRRPVAARAAGWCGTPLGLAAALFAGRVRRPLRARLFQDPLFGGRPCRQEAARASGRCTASTSWRTS